MFFHGSRPQHTCSTSKHWSPSLIFICSAGSWHAAGGLVVSDKNLGWQIEKGKAVRTSSHCRCCKQAIIATSHHAWQQSVAVVASRQVFSIYVNKDNTPSNWRGLSCSGCKQSPSEDLHFKVLSWNMQLNISPLVSSLKNHSLQQVVCRLKD